MIVYILSICLTLLTPISAYAAKSTPYVDSTSGTLRIGWASDKRTIILVDEPGLIKTTFDSGWNYVRDEWSQQAVEFLNDLGGQNFVDLHLDFATTEKARLQVMPIDDGVSLNYVLHDNQVDVKLMPLWSDYALSYEVHFDLAISMTVKVDGEGRQISIEAISVSPEVTQVRSLDFKSFLVYLSAQAIVDNSIEEPMQKISQYLTPGIHEVQTMLNPIIELLSSIPNEMVYFNIDVDSEHGDISLCFKSNTTDVCHFDQ